MNPLRVQAQNYRSFASLDLELPTGCVAVVGENGAGKSSIVNLIDLALFGSRSLSGYLSDDALDEEMVIGLEFEHRGETYRIRRTYSGRGRGKSSLDFEVFDDLPIDKHTGEGWRPLTRENAAATQELIEQTVGLSRETFRASAFLAQGDGAAFTEAQPRDRKAILCEVLGLDIWDRLHERARREITTIHDQTSRLSIQVEEADRELVTKPGVEIDIATYTQAESDASTQLVWSEETHTKAVDSLNRSREHAAKLDGARQVLASRERELEQLRTRRRQVELALEDAAGLPKLKAESETLAGRRESLEADLAAAREGEKARDKHKWLTAERARIRGEVTTLNEKAQGLRDEATLLAENGPDATRCDRCQQLLGTEALAVSITALRAEADDLDLRARTFAQAAEQALSLIKRAAEAMAEGPNAAKQAELEAALRVANEAEKTLAGIAEREKQVEGLAVEFAQMEVREPELQTARNIAGRDVKEIEAKVGPLEDYERAVAEAYGVLHEARNAVEGAKQRLAVAQAELDRLTKLENRATENRAALAAHQSELDLLHLAERAYGRDGIPALIIENAAIPQIEAEASRILAELGTDLRVELRTQRALKSGDGLREALDIIVCSSAGERSYETFSGGERTRLNLALRIALARLLAHRRGAEVRMLAIDEPDGLDAAGFAALSSILQGMTGDFDKVLVISHHPDLQTAFDQTLVVEKEDGRSRVVGAAVPEAVPA